VGRLGEARPAAASGDQHHYLLLLVALAVFAFLSARGLPGKEPPGSAVAWADGSGWHRPALRPDRQFAERIGTSSGWRAAQPKRIQGFVLSRKDELGELGAAHRLSRGRTAQQVGCCFSCPYSRFFIPGDGGSFHECCYLVVPASRSFCRCVQDLTRCWPSFIRAS